MVSYAVLVTIIAVVATIWIGRVAARTEEEEAGEGEGVGSPVPRCPHRNIPSPVISFFF